MMRMRNNKSPDCQLHQGSLYTEWHSPASALWPALPGCSAKTRRRNWFVKELLNYNEIQIIIMVWAIWKSIKQCMIQRSTADLSFKFHKTHFDDYIFFTRHQTILKTVFQYFVLSTKINSS